MNIQGRLDIFVGSMFAEKTSTIVRKLNQLSDIGFQVLYINHSFDTRAEEYSTHSKLLAQKLNYDTLKTSSLQDIPLETMLKYDVIGIDEAQFYDESIISFVTTLTDLYRKYVLVSGLDGDSNRNKFGYILDLIPHADNVAKLHAYCKECSIKGHELKNAIFTHKFTRNSETIDIGMADKYEPVCRDCYNNFNK